MPSATVVIPVYNRVDLLVRTLAGLAAQGHPDFEVVVADDGSEENVAEAVTASSSPVSARVVRRERDGYGAGQARNLGAAAAGSPVLIFIDADCLPDPDLVQNHLRWHDHKGRVVIGSRHHLDTSTISIEEIAAGAVPLRRLAFGTDQPTPDQLRSTDFRRVLHRRTGGLRRGDQSFRSLVSSNFSLRRDLFLDCGGFSEDFHRWGGEDTELGWRLFNRGADFIADEEAIIYHQTQVDAGPEGWRGESRQFNEGLIRTKIPHRFYRISQPGWIYQVPKVTVLVERVVGPRLRDLWGQLLDQRLTDWDLIAVDDGSAETAGLAEELSADPRFQLAAGVEAAWEHSRGEYVAFLHGAAGLDHRLLSRTVKRLEDRPAATSVRVPYQVTTATGADVFRRAEDLDLLDEAWAGPVFALVRRRDLARAGGVAGLAGLIAEGERLPDPLVALPAHRPAEGATSAAPPLTSERSLLASDLRRGPGQAVRALPRYLVSRLRGSPYRRPAPTTVEKSRPGPGEGIRARYIGWSGHSNLGDEALLQAIRALLPWCEIATAGPAQNLLLVGGGTLINRGYLRQVLEHDSPRVERVVFGTGVANPSYWGTPKEDPAGWVEFLATCGLVGVRGPISAELLRSFGYRGRLEVIGDPALALLPPPVEAVAGRVVVSPAYARGELWGGDDQVVFNALAEVV
ncbi:MAG TPA: glycosyltransferase, partial [Acidimicrobiia bacterium]|nr:glycosyltransferase [Acidimicrobiia bacterium]